MALRACLLLVSSQGYEGLPYCDFVVAGSAPAPSVTRRPGRQQLMVDGRIQVNARQQLVLAAVGPHELAFTVAPAGRLGAATARLRVVPIAFIVGLELQNPEQLKPIEVAFEAGLCGHVDSRQGEEEKGVSSVKRNIPANAHVPGSTFAQLAAMQHTTQVDVCGLADVALAGLPIHHAVNAGLLGQLGNAIDGRRQINFINHRGSNYGKSGDD
jgi:hypothetical protein